MADFLNNEVEISSEDFKLVQADKKIFDKKLETKPTTFFKDSLKRFSKNKSSVVGTYILGILILLAIFVPLFSTYNYSEPRTDEAFLAPKLFKSGTGFWDGTRKYSNIVYDLDAEAPAGFNKAGVISCVVDDFVTYTNQATNYGRNGYVMFTNETKKANTLNYLKTYRSVDFKANEEFAVTYELLDEDNCLNYKISEYDVCIFDENNEPVVVLKAKSKDFGIQTINISKALQDNGLTNVEGYFGFRVYGVEENYAYILIKNCTLTSKSVDNEVQDLLTEISFTDATKMVKVEKAEGATTFPDAYWSCDGRKGVYKSEIIYCSFVYDTYEIPYGEQSVIFAKSELDKSIKAGYVSFTAPKVVINPGCAYGKIISLKYDYDEDGNHFLTGAVFQVSSTNKTQVEVSALDFDAMVNNGEVEYTDFTFEVLDEDKSPLYEVHEVNYNTITGMLLTIKGTSPKYIKLGYDKMPFFIFGTNDKGQDMFTKAFRGLRTSLLLGLCTAVFCFAFGLCWGAISGYFGGTVDLLMERFCELLSGVPFIVMMTLIMLHFGKTFGTFAVALCLTGWMGTAARVRTQFYRFKGREYVLASRTLGSSDLRLIFRHILPNSLGTIITGSVFMITSVIFSEATLAYLGLGLTNVESFGVMMSDNQKYLQAYPNLVIFPAVVIALIMISFNLFGNGLRDAVNPQLKGSE